MARSISKKLRFEIFKRDLFACQYCGQRPPAVMLEIDHIIAVSDGGLGEQANLITACFDCNRGKGAVPLAARSPPEDFLNRRQLVQERIEQAAAYHAVLQVQRESEDAAIDEIISVYETQFPGYTLLDKIRPSIRKFIRQLPQPAVMAAMEIACARLPWKEIRSSSSPVFKYFCSVCWRMIREKTNDPHLRVED